MQQKHFFGLLGLSLVLFLTTTVPAAQAGGKLSHRVERVVSAIESWNATGAAGPVDLPAHLLGAVEGLPASGNPLAASAEPRVRLLIQTENAQALRDAGYTVRTVAGTIATVTSPVSRVRALESVSGLRYVELPRQLEPLLDVSLGETKADQVHGSAAPPYGGNTGLGVVVGVVDSGTDYDHEDFDNGSGNTRIYRLWDQENTTTGTSPAGFGYGAEWTDTQMDNGTADHADTDGHGTHVAGIAAGSGRAAATAPQRYEFTGVAPEATIVSVATNFFEDGILDAVSYIFDQATTLGQPAVVNLSLGGQFGAHDGTNFLDLGLTALSGPGRIITAAAGNEGNQGLHSEAVVGPTKSYVFNLSLGNYSAQSGAQNDVVLLEGWSHDTAQHSVSVITPGGTTVGPATLGVGSEEVGLATADGQVFIGVGSSTVSGDRYFEIDIFDGLPGSPPVAGTWQIVIENQNGSDPAEWDNWITLNTLGADVVWSSDVDPEEMIASPGSATNVIAVGAYVTKISWSSISGPCAYLNPPALGGIAPFSSPGPRRDGVEKPLISAPGMGIAGAKGTDALNPNFTSECGTTPDGFHVTSQGTSQACPHVTGAIALMLQSTPTADLPAIENALIQSAMSAPGVAETAGGGPTFDSSFGYGKLDALEALNGLIIPVRLLSITAAWENGDAVVRWKLAETEPGARFTVERSAGQAGDFRAVSESMVGDLEWAWTDPNPQDHERWYRVAVQKRDGASERFGPVRLDPQATALRLMQNVPNPFNKSTIITFELERPRNVSLEVVDVTGRLVKNVASGLYPAGRHEILWDGRDASGRSSAAGIYFYRLRTPTTVQVRQLVRTQ